ncbi:helix-turn-helix transcriptional regulator [Nocardioides sp. MAHUQ-72]|uniref:helix-turn-helix transcriptional regulator n=1 Tax=unclassified Nocardioides TaxID=2615069 RepID=UPI003613A5D8
MPDLLLSDTDQAALRSLQAAEPVPGRPLPGDEVLEQLARLIPCDALGALLSDPEVGVVEEVELLRGRCPRLAGTGYDGPVALGLLRWTRTTGGPGPPWGAGAADCIALGVRTGREAIAQIWLDRRARVFTPRDLLVLSVVAPTLRRLVREAAPVALPDDLTVQERRTLALVATGLSNAEVAERMSVATCTVRKHLEHAYRKLGVTNRLAAATALHGRALGAEVSPERE